MSSAALDNPAQMLTLNLAEAYDPATNTWSTRAPMPTARTLLAAATGPDGLTYVFGGLPAGPGVLNTVEAYDPVTNTWRTVPSMPTVRCAWRRQRERTRSRPRRGR